MPAKTLRNSLNKAFLKVKPNRNQIDDFKKNLQRLLDNASDGESEEHHKNLVADFLKSTYYSPDYYINTKDNKD